MRIRSYFGTLHSLSEEIYEVTDIASRFQPYPIGTKVRLIQCCESFGVGHHFSKDFVTVCDVNANNAEFVGIKRKHIKKVKKWQ